MDTEMSTLPEETFADRAAERLVHDILRGVLAPGQKLGLEALKEQYGVGASPLREALSRLAALGFVTAISHRGFRVTEISQDDLHDITTVRQVVEIAMVEESIRVGDDEWEVGIIAAFARMSRAATGAATAAPVPFSAFDASHKLFHRALVGGCRSPRLARMQDLLFDQAFRYRDMIFRELKDRADFLGMHERLMHDVLSRDIARATAGLRDHLHLTQSLVFQGGSTPPWA